MAKIQPSIILKDGCYEMINNIKVLQPQYLKSVDKKILKEQIKKFKDSHEYLLRKKIPTESSLL